MTPCQECQKKVEFSIVQEAVKSRFLINLFQYQLRMSELLWLHSLVKHNVAAKHGSSKPLTSNELWLLELGIKSTRILAPIPDALWDMCKSSITRHRTPTEKFSWYLFSLVLKLKSNIMGSYDQATHNGSCFHFARIPIILLRLMIHTQFSKRCLR